MCNLLVNKDLPVRGASGMVDSNKFVQDVETLLPLEVIRKYVTFGSVHALREDSYYELKQLVSEKFSVHPSAVMLVGSGKLGFSIAPDRWLTEFGDHSDLDVAIVSQDLFDRYWEILYDFQRSGGFWADESKQKFAKYLLEGWIRPDHFPRVGKVPQADAWWDFWSDLTRSRRFGPYKVRGGLYRSWHFLESYQKKCIEIQQRNLEVLKLGRQ